MNYILLFGMPGGGELFIIVLIVIMFFGSKKIPELARGLGKGMREIKNVTNDIQKEIKEGTREINTSKVSADVKKQNDDMITKQTTDGIKEKIVISAQTSDNSAILKNLASSDNA